MMETAITDVELITTLDELRKDLENNLWLKIKGRSDKFLIERSLIGGKRLRPVLLLTVFKALGGSEYQKALDVATALELAHSASLVHDDILDYDVLRRGRMSLWHVIGMGKAVLQGHRIINLAFDIVLSVGVEFARIFVDAWERASKGILDEVINKSVLTERLYLMMIREKTASIFEAACHAGAVLAGAGEDVVRLMRKYGIEVGTAYQLADDLAETYLKKRRGRILYILEEMRDRFLHLLIAQKTGRLPSLFRAVTPFTPREDFLKQQLFERIKSAVNIAKDPSIPDTPFRRILQKLPVYLVLQMFEEARQQA